MWNIYQRFTKPSVYIIQGNKLLLKRGYLRVVVQYPTYKKLRSLTKVMGSPNGFLMN
jgi:hypothetical protein